MEKSIWFGRNSVLRLMAREATVAETRLIHGELSIEQMGAGTTGYGRPPPRQDRN
jgi:hypothetical protein